MWRLYKLKVLFLDWDQATFDRLYKWCCICSSSCTASTSVLNVLALHVLLALFRMILSSECTFHLLQASTTSLNVFARLSFYQCKRHLRERWPEHLSQQKLRVSSVARHAEAFLAGTVQICIHSTKKMEISMNALKPKYVNTVWSLAMFCS